MKYTDTLLPNQRILKKFYNDKDFYKSIYELISSTTKFKEPNKKYNLIKHKKVNHMIMGSNPVSLQFITFLIKLIQPKNLLEIDVLSVFCRNFFLFLKHPMSIQLKN